MRQAVTSGSLPEAGRLPSAAPRLNGARVFGVRPNRPFRFAIAASGARPMRFTAAGLPPGLRLDEDTGIITGTLTARGTCDVLLAAANSHGCATRPLRLVVGDAIALTPPMGCNTYGGWGPNVTEANVRDAAQALVRTGLTQHGYSFVNIDDGWQGRRGGPLSAIQPNEKFGDLRRFCDDLHALGLRTGIYSTPWTTSYEGFVGGSSDHADGAWTRPNPPRSGTGRFGSFCFAEADARQWAEWGFDYCKYDWKIDDPAHAQRLRDALDASGRDVVLELSNDAPLAQADSFTRIANMCRTTGDIVDVWDRSQLDEAKRRWALGVRDIWERHRHWQPFNRPGHWNMPCPLRVGMLGGWDLKPLQPTRLTPDEQRTHISLWCLWSAPLIIGCPPERLDAFTLGLLTNDEVLDIDQDPLGQQARQMAIGPHEVLVKALEDGTTAVGLFNPGNAEDEVAVEWQDLGMTGPRLVRDLWRQEDIGTYETRFSTPVAPHGVVLVRLLQPTAGKP